MESLSIPVLITLIMVATGVAIAVRWIKIPYSIALVLVGLAISLFHLLPPVELTPHLIMLVFLPALLFEASWNIDLRLYRNCAKPVVLFATIGVFVATLITAWVLQQTTGISMSVALVFGAMLAATDPISVLALFKKSGVQKRLTAILEGESLLNDGTAVVLFNLLLASAIAGTAVDWSKVGLDFLITSLGATALGAAIGYAASRITRFFDDHLLEITLTVITAYGSFLLAEHLKVSPIIAVLLAGIVMGNYGSRTAMSASTRLAVNSFWEYSAFIAESLVFLMIGLQINLELLIKYSGTIGFAILAVLVGRMVAIYGLSPFVSTKSQPIPLAWQHLLFWGGLRGALCMAMALSLPKDFPAREFLIVTSFGVVMFTLVVQGLSVEVLLKGLKLVSADESESRFRALKSELKKHESVLAKLKESFQQARLLKKDYLEKKESAEGKIHEIELTLKLMREKNPMLEEIERVQLEKTLMIVQKDCLMKLARKGTMSQELIDSYVEKLNTDLDHLPKTTELLVADENVADLSKPTAELVMLTEQVAAEESFESAAADIACAENDDTAINPDR